jgi:hypothetical protein
MCRREIDRLKAQDKRDSAYSETFVVENSILGFHEGTTVTVRLLEQSVALGADDATETAMLPYSCIAGASRFLQNEETKIKKNPWLRAACGGLWGSIFGAPVIGAIIGAMTGIGHKTKVGLHSFQVINYQYLEEGFWGKQTTKYAAVVLREVSTGACELCDRIMARKERDERRVQLLARGKNRSVLP